MAYTLVEYAKTFDDTKKRAVIELFPDAVDFWGVLPYKTAPGGRHGYIREGGLPTNMAFRAINEVPASGTGILNDFTEQCFPMAGNIDVDRVLISRDTNGSARSLREAMEVKAKAKKWADTFIFGDNMSQPREFTGLKQRLRAVGTGSTSVDGSNYESRVVANSQASGGGPLSLSMLDIAIGNTENPNAIIMPKALRERFPAAVRNAAVGGLYTNDKEDMGHRVERYRGIPLYVGYGLSPHGAFLPFNEVGFGGGAAVTASLYIVSFGEMGVCGIETKPMEVTDMGLIDDGVTYRTNVEHDSGICIEGAYAATRLTSVTNAAIVA
jgi:hypothetical protein